MRGNVASRSGRSRRGGGRRTGRRNSTGSEGESIVLGGDFVFVGTRDRPVITTARSADNVDGLWILLDLFLGLFVVLKKKKKMLNVDCLKR